MTGPEHYIEAERDIAQAGKEEDPSYYYARAQVHATLALAAATVNSGDAYPSHWREVLS